MNAQIREYIYRTIGLIEVGIGLTTVVGCFIVQTFSMTDFAPKPFSLYVFVATSSVISIILGIGMLFIRNWARMLLIFFSGYVVLTKLMIYAGLLTFSTQILTVIPAASKDITSLIYHCLLIIVLSKTK